MMFEDSSLYHYHLCVSLHLISFHQLTFFKQSLSTIQHTLSLSCARIVLYIFARIRLLFSCEITKDKIRKQIATVFFLKQLSSYFWLPLLLMLLLSMLLINYYLRKEVYRKNTVQYTRRHYTHCTSSLAYKISAQLVLIADSNQM